MNWTETNWLSHRAGISGQKNAILFENKALTYQELDTMRYSIQSLLSIHGISEDEPIAIYLPNCPEYIATIFAINGMGAIFVPINTRLSEQEIEWQLRRIDTKYVITRSDYFPHDFDAIETIKIDQAPLKKPASLIEREGEFDQTACLVFTSGTTGKPKTVPLSYKNLFFSWMSSAIRLGHQHCDNWLLGMPLYHLGGLSIVFRSILNGITITLMTKFDEQAILEAIDTNKISIVSLVPTMLDRLIAEDSKGVLNQLRLILLGGAAAPNTLLRRANELDLPVAFTYGMTEISSQFATALPGDQKRKLGTVGKPLLFNDFKIISEDGTQLEPNEIGMLIVSSPALMEGYWGTEIERSQYFIGKYFITGDLAYSDEEGDLFILQRRNDLIISGGENIYPREIESLLHDYPEIDDCVVLARTDAEWGQVPVAVMKINSSVDRTEITNRLKLSLATYKVPKMYYVIDIFPRTSSGKIIRTKIQELLDNNRLRELH